MTVLGEDVMIVHGKLFFILSGLLGIAAFIVSALEAPWRGWAVPLFVGALAALAAGFYQRWWVKSVFETPPVAVRAHHRRRGWRART